MKKILVLANQATSGAIESPLSKKEYSIKIVSNSREASKYIKDTQSEIRSEPDVILLGLPEGLDKQKIKAIKAIEGHPPVVGVLKGDAGRIIERASKSGVEDFIIYPCKPAYLKLRIEGVLKSVSKLKALRKERWNLENIIEITSLVSSSLDSDKILYLTVKKIAEIMPVIRCSILRIDSKNKSVHVIATFEDPKIKDLKLDLRKYPEIRKALTSKEPVIINDVNTDPLMHSVRDIISPLGIKSIIVLPIIFQDELIGTLFLKTSRAGKSFTKDEIKFCTAVANASANALHNALLYGKSEVEKTRLEKLAITDYLTGVFNIRYFYHRLKEEFSRAVRYTIPLACMMADIDFFKRINDTYGHKTGDRVLREFAQLLKKNTRESDILARYGGEEFIILLPNTTRDGAVAEAERIRHSISNHEFNALGGKETLKVSLGVATIPHEDINTPDALISCADNALLLAKTSGRDQVAVFNK
ncbi:MAG: diguanylate cyclase [Nitrospirae bacterium]|nr:diguanylate cyclase [Nitrospirota bacterium]